MKTKQEILELYKEVKEEVHSAGRYRSLEQLAYMHALEWVLEIE